MCCGDSNPVKVLTTLPGVGQFTALPRMDLAAQRRRTMSRCQRTIVSGDTSSRSP
jgi:hypothetical protein